MVNTFGKKRNVEQAEYACTILLSGTLGTIGLVPYTSYSYRHESPTLHRKSAGEAFCASRTSKHVHRQLPAVTVHLTCFAIITSHLFFRFDKPIGTGGCFMHGSCLPLACHDFTVRRFLSDATEQKLSTASQQKHTCIVVVVAVAAFVARHGSQQAA